MMFMETPKMILNKKIMILNKKKIFKLKRILISSMNNKIINLLLILILIIKIKLIIITVIKKIN